MAKIKQQTKNWRKIRLGEVFNVSREFGRKFKVSEYKKKGKIPVYDQGNNEISGYTDDVSSVYRGELPAILFGDHTLKLRIINHPFSIGADGIQILEPSKEIFDRVFFFYCLKFAISKLLKSYGYERHLKYLREVEVVILEDINEQKRIADILSAFDEKIELNNKINQILEEMAQAIFKEWFVKFRFPGWRKVKFVDSELGKIPEGWRIKKIGELADIISRGSNLTYVQNKEKGIPVLNQRCIRKDEIVLEAIRYAKPSNEKFYLKKWDILINSMGTGTLGRVGRNLSIDYPMIIHNCITFIRANNRVLQIYLYYQIKNHEKYFEQLAIGSTGQVSLPLKTIKDLKVLLPAEVLLDQFFEIVKPMWEKIGQLKKENQKLSALRDLLLPKLMSGEIRV